MKRHFGATILVCSLLAVPVQAASRWFRAGVYYVPQAEVFWVTYHVAINGAGGMAKDSESTTWTIDRSYLGIMALRKMPGQGAEAAARLQASIAKLPASLVTAEMRAAIAKSTGQLSKEIWMPVGGVSRFRPGQIRIHDERERVFVDRGGEAGVGKCRATYNETWKYNGSGVLMSNEGFQYDAELGTLAINFGFAAEPFDIRPVKYTFSPGGDCTTSYEAATRSLPIDSVKMAETAITTATGGRFVLPKGAARMSDENWEYTSPPMPVKRDIDGFPGSKGEVTVTVRLRFSRTRPY